METGSTVAGEEITHPAGNSGKMVGTIITTKRGG